MTGADSDHGAAGRRHPDLGPELRQLAQTILDRLDPAVQAAAAYTSGAGEGAPGPCQQVWCPVCALAALVSGEQHPLLAVVAEHSVALLTVIRAMVDDLGDRAGDTRPGTDGDSRPPPDEPPPDEPPPGGNGGSPPAGPGRYQHIPIRVDD